MTKRLLLNAAAAIALAGSALAQSTQSAPVVPPPAATVPAPERPEARQPNGETANPALVRPNFYTANPGDMLASSLIDLDVHNAQNEEIGEIEDLILDQNRNIKAIIVDIEGFLGVGGRRVAITPDSLMITRDRNGGLKAALNATKEELRNAPEFKSEGRRR